MTTRVTTFPTMCTVSAGRSRGIPAWHSCLCGLIRWEINHTGKNACATKQTMKRARVALFVIFPLLLAAQQSELWKELRFRLLGPFRGGRSVAVAGVPSQPNVYYFGGVGGGVWKTT